MRRMIMASAAIGLAVTSSIAEDVKDLSFVDAADACVLAKDDFDAGLARLEGLGWTYAVPAEVDTIARAISEFGNLGGLRPRPGTQAFDPSELIQRIDQIQRDVPLTVTRLLADFPGEVFADRAKLRAVLTTSDSAYVVILNMQPPAKICGLLASKGVSDPSHTSETLAGLEDVLERYFPDHTRWIEADGADGPMLAIDFHGVQETTDKPYPSAHYYVLDPERIAEHTKFEFWTGQVFAFFLQDL